MKVHPFHCCCWSRGRSASRVTFFLLPMCVVFAERFAVQACLLLVVTARAPGVNVLAILLISIMLLATALAARSWLGRS